ncbi:hypothetical protein HDU77_005207 [Chytriomyces hyalinus]|nr:hypothetical protein HDU77_005207 [Chytriomyces hyalinus]
MTSATANSSSASESASAPKFDFDKVLLSLDALYAATSSEESEGDATALAQVLAEHQRMMAWVDTVLVPHQERQARIVAVQQRVQTASEAILQLVQVLRTAQTGLEHVLAEALQRKQLRSEAAPLDHALIINHARRLARYTSPPSNPSVPAIPPIPQDAHMKRSMLYMPNQLDTLVNADALNASSAVQPEVVMELDMLRLVQNQSNAHEEVDEDELNLDLRLFSCRQKNIELVETPNMSTPFQKAALARRSHRSLTAVSTLSDAELEQLVEFALVNSPSSNNSQTSRVVLLLKEEHVRFWEMAKNGARKVQEGDHLANTLLRHSNFQKGYGTILLFEDSETYKGSAQLQDHGAGILHYVLWTSIAEAGMGASLQHQQSFAQDEAKEAYSLPATWNLVAQMPFGVVAEGVTLPVKSVVPLETRFKSFGGEK